MRLIINIRNLLGKFEYESSSSNDKFPTVTDLSQKIVPSMNMPISLSIPSYHKEFCLWYRKVALACSLLSSSTMRYDGWVVTGDAGTIELLRVLFGLIHSILRIRIHTFNLIETNKDSSLEYSSIIIKTCLQSYCSIYSIKTHIHIQILFLSSITTLIYSCIWIQNLLLMLI